MRISDWSSDVCSSDLLRRAYRLSPAEISAALVSLLDSEKVEADRRAAEAGLAMLAAGGDFEDGVILHQTEIGRCAALIHLDRRLARLAADRGCDMLGTGRVGGRPDGWVAGWEPPATPG